MTFTSKYRQSLMTVFIIITTLCALSDATDKKEVIRRAAQSLYNLKARGLLQFSCRVSPDFEATYKDIKMDDVGRKQVLPAAKNVQFQVVVGPSGAANVSHIFTEAPATQEIGDRLQKISAGMEQVVSGFFQTWSSLMIKSPFSGSPDDYQLEENSDGYHLIADAANTHVEIVLDRGFTPTSVVVRSSEFDGTVHPHFEKLKDESILRSYEATYKTNGGSAQDLTVKVDYQDVEGLALPRTIEAIMALPQGHIDAPITLSNCQAKKSN